MSTPLVCKNYAKALLDFSKEQGKQSEVRLDMKALLDTLLQNPSLLKILHAPVVSESEKRKLIETIFNKLTDLTKNFLSVLEHNGRVSLIDSIASYFEKVYKKTEGISNVSLTSGLPLDKKVEDIIKKKIALFGIKIENLETKLDPSILGGYLLKINNSVYDDTLNTKLSKLKQQVTD